MKKLYNKPNVNIMKFQNEDCVNFSIESSVQFKEKRPYDVNSKPFSDIVNF